MSAPQTMPALLDDVTARFGDRPAVVTGDVTMTWNDVRTQAHAVARALVASGVAPAAAPAPSLPLHSDAVDAMLLLAERAFRQRRVARAEALAGRLMEQG